MPPREVVGLSSGRHHRWFKNQWGPPTDAFASVKRTDDLIHPYELTVEFSLPLLYGDERKTENEARAALQAAGAVVVQEPTDVAAGLLVAKVRDTEGNLIGVKQPPASA